ncbi:MAG: glycosyltransferase family 10 [Sulfuricella sp.]|nr:glycosyltransferase family 10 [Sulfuricella sp.]
MIIGSIFQDGHSRNSLFSTEDSVHRYNPTYTPILLRNEFLALGIEINTPDMNEGRQVAFELHVEGRTLVGSDVPRYLIATENPFINRLNDDPEYFKQFARAFTWNPKFFGLGNVTPILVPNQLAWAPFTPYAGRDLFACLINANKGFPYTLDTDLYQERIRVIRWYERHAPGQFALYGMGWNKPARGLGMLSQLRRRIDRLRSQLYGYKPFPSYRGEVRFKRDVLQRCKFSYCYENVRDLPNYVTEKIFDSLLAGCVPIYWGANNVAELIPPGCFIDRREFDDMDSLHRFLQSIDEKRYAQYQTAIRNFLSSEAAQRFSSEHYVKTITESIASNLGRG